jgi:hypothetical protein
MLDRVQVRALGGLFKERLVHSETCPEDTPELSWLRVVVLLEDERSALSEVLSALDQVFKDISLYSAPFIFPLILTSLPVPTAVKHPHSTMLVPPSFTVGMVLGFLQT